MQAIANKFDNRNLFVRKLFLCTIWFIHWTKFIVHADFRTLFDFVSISTSSFIIRSSTLSLYKFDVQYAIGIGFTYVNVILFCIFDVFISIRIKRNIYINTLNEQSIAIVLHGRREQSIPQATAHWSNKNFFNQSRFQCFIKQQ